jgi:hypothetical protein
MLSHVHVHVDADEEGATYFPMRDGLSFTSRQMASPTPLEPPVTMQRSGFPLRFEDAAEAKPQSQFSPCATRLESAPPPLRGRPAASCGAAANPAATPGSKAASTENPLIGEFWGPPLVRADPSQPQAPVQTVPHVVI